MTCLHKLTNKREKRSKNTHKKSCLIKKHLFEKDKKIGKKRAKKTRKPPITVQTEEKVYKQRST
jgi:hypothetical protein